MVTLRMTRQEAETIIDVLEQIEPTEHLHRWMIAADIRESCGCLPFQRENVPDEEKARRMARLKHAYGLAKYDVPDWETSTEARNRENQNPGSP